MHRSLLSVVLCLSVLFSAIAAAQDASYTFTTIDAPFGSTRGAFGINTAGQIVGQFLDGGGEHGFLKDGATFTTIDVPGAEHTFLRGINTAGEIIGYYGSTGEIDGKVAFITHGFLLSGGNLTIIDVPGSISTWAFGINDWGHIVGAYQDAQFLQHGFLLMDGNFTTIDFPGTISNTGPTGINNAGHIVGNYQFGDGRVHSFLLMDGNFTTIDVPGASSTLAWKINDGGVIVGEFSAPGRQDGFILIDGDYTTVIVPDSSITAVYGINNQGQLVGAFQDAMIGRTHGFLATPVPVDTIPLAITIAANPATLWPPNGRLVTVTVSGTITDEPNSSGVKSAAYTVRDEYGQIQPSGNFIPGADGRYAFTVALQASRRGNDQDGRQYLIVVSATDNAGNPSDASATVTVPHDQGG